MAQHQVTLSWTPSVDMHSPIPSGDGYNIYRAVEPTVPVAPPINGTTPITSNTFVDTNVQGGLMYNYFVTAVVGGNQSSDSNKVSVTVPLFPQTALVATAI